MGGLAGWNTRIASSASIKTVEVASAGNNRQQSHWRRAAQRIPDVVVRDTVTIA
jgi:hypothetical protein